MSQNLKLKLEKRIEKTDLVRMSGFVPGVMYGQGKPAISVKAPELIVNKLFKEAGSNQLVDVDLEGKSYNVLFHDVQIDPLTGKLKHFDMYKVKMDEKIKTEIPLHFVNDSPAVYTHNAVLLKNIEEIEVEALPAHLPEFIEIDLETIKEIGDDVFVRDLIVAKDVSILNDPDELVVKADPPRSEEELEELEKPQEEESVDVESEHGGKQEDAEESQGKAESVEAEE
jgi:large subunit ribosomal protein L25